MKEMLMTSSFERYEDLVTLENSHFPQTKPSWNMNILGWTNLHISLRNGKWMNKAIYNSSKHQPYNVRSVNLLSQIFCSSLAGIRTHATEISWHQIACTVAVPLDHLTTWASFAKAYSLIFHCWVDV